MMHSKMCWMGQGVVVTIIGLLWLLEAGGWYTISGFPISGLGWLALLVFLKGLMVLVHCWTCKDCEMGK